MTGVYQISGVQSVFHINCKSERGVKMQQLGSSRIVSVGKYLPETRVRPKEMVEEIGAHRFGLENNIVENTMGILEMRHSASDEKPSDLAIAASEMALHDSGVNPDYIDLIIFCGIEGDYAEPSTAHYIQHKLGLKGICFDVSNACLGFATGMQIANDMIANGSVRYALVCTGERPSVVSKAVIRQMRECRCKYTFKRKVGMLSVGDAGGAVLMGSKFNGAGFIKFSSTSLGRHADLCYYKMCESGVDGQMIMNRICSLTIDLHKKLYKQTISSLDWESESIDCMVTHQVGSKAFKILSEQFDIVDKKMTCTYPRLGNITSATLPVNLSLAEEKRNLSSGDMVYIALSGSGISVLHAGLIM